MSGSQNPGAFPVSEVRDAYGQGIVEGSPGMSLRDWFAGQALPVVTALLGRDVGTADMLARDAYTIADAMLAARQDKADDGLQTEAAAPGTGEKLLTIAREFIDKHHVSCAEATVDDGVYEEAPLLVEQLAEVVGYYTYPEDDA